MKRIPQAGLFDAFEEETALNEPEKCTHPAALLKPTETVWPGETSKRMTMTCVCGWYRGRYPKEGVTK